MNRSAKVIDLRVGDPFLFDDQVLTVAEPPQVTWGLVEIWVEEWGCPFEATDSAMVDLAVGAVRPSGAIRASSGHQPEEIATHGAPHPAARNPW